MTQPPLNQSPCYGRQIHLPLSDEIAKKQETTLENEVSLHRTSAFSEIPFYAPPTSVALASLSELPPMPSYSREALKDAVSAAMDAPPVEMPAPGALKEINIPQYFEPKPLPSEDAAPEIADEISIPISPVHPAPIERPPAKEIEIEPSNIADQENDDRAEYSDADLIGALLPVVETSLEKALYAPNTGLHMYLEPMLRATVRRAIAEQMQTMHHFGQISFSDRMAWRMKALVSSRTYDEIVFERTHRYQVEEVYLLRPQSKELISYASHNPSRHANPRKIRYDLGRLIDELHDAKGEEKRGFDLPNGRSALIRGSDHCLMIAIVRGRPNALVRADLDYVLTQVEHRFGARLTDPGQHFIHVLQPMLEGCLLIQSPPAPK